MKIKFLLADNFIVWFQMLCRAAFRVPLQRRFANQCGRNAAMPWRP